MDDVKTVLYWRTLFVLTFVWIFPAQAEVVINEFVAVSSDRLLRREAGMYPRVGHTTPWQWPAYDDSRWLSGAGPFGFGSFSGVTISTELSGPIRNRAASLYLRKRFNVSAANAASTGTLQLLTRYNDGFIAFLNGVEVARRNMGNPGMFAFHDQTAYNTSANQAPLETISLGAANTRLVAGENVLCIQVHNQSLADSAGANFLFMADLRIQGGAILVSNQSEWKYLPGLSEPSGGVLDYGLFHAFASQGAMVAWAARGFNDATWRVGHGPVGIEGANPPDYLLGVNLYSEAFNVTPSIYTRRVFPATASEAASASPLRITLDYDDGLIVYLNGRELIRRNVGTPGVPTPHNAFASGLHNANGDNGGTVTGQAETIQLGAAQDWLVEGDNVLAVQLHRVSLTSSDAIARVTLETTGAGARVLCRPSDTVSYFLGLREPVIEGEQEDMGPLEEAPDAENDWIELHNTGGASVSLDGWSLTDNAQNLRKWMFPPGVTIPPGGYLLVLATGLDTGPAEGATYLHTNFRLSSDGEYLALVNAGGHVATEFAPVFPPQDYFHSYGRDTNGNWGFLAAATPGVANVGTALAPAPAAPVFSVPGGFYNGSLALMLTTATPGATIRYTLDGRDPAETGITYAGPISITVDRIVRARAVKPGALRSAVVTHTYLMNESAARRSLPALCLGGDPSLVFYGPNAGAASPGSEGILAIKGGAYVNDMWTGNNDASAFNNPILRGRATEKPAALEYYPLAGEPLRTEIGLRIAVSPWSRPRMRLTDAMTARFNPWDGHQKPSFNLFFRSEFGDRPLEYPFFTNSPVTRFQDIRARAGKNDVANPFIRDELMRRLFIGTGQKGSIGTFCTLYINGVFKGYYNLCERVREGFLQEHHGSSEAWDVQQVSEFSSGDPIHWNKTIASVRSGNLATLAAYQAVHEYLDVDNFIDYLVVHTFAGVWDWPHNNWIAARERSQQGRWRFYMWDAEGAFGIYDRPVSYNSFTSDLLINDAQTTSWLYLPALYTLLRASPEFRLRFADRAQKHLFDGGCLVRTNMQATYLALRNQINPIMQETLGQSVDDSFYNNWIVSDTRRNTYLSQLTQQSLWPATRAPALSRHGGLVAQGFTLTISNPNAGGVIYFTTNGVDPRAPGGAIAGQLYTGAIALNQTCVVRARVRSNAGEWSPVTEANFVIPPARPEFLPAGNGDWTADANWSSAPLPYPNSPGALVSIPPPGGAERNVNLRAPVTVAGIHFPQGESAAMNRVRDRDTGNQLTFHSTNAPARIDVGGTGIGYVEFDVAAGTILQSSLQLHVTNIVGHADYGALRLRSGWSGGGGLFKSGIGVASLTGEGKVYTGPTVVQNGVLAVTQPATPTASSAIEVQTGGQLRLISANDASGPRIYTFGTAITLAGFGRGPEVPDASGAGKRGAMRYDPGANDNKAIVTNPILLAAPTDIHVDGTRNTLELAGAISGPHLITKSGGGTLRLTANNAAHQHGIYVENGTLLLAGDIGSSITVNGNAAMAGHGAAGPIAGDGTLALHRTVLHVPSASGLRHAFVFGQTGSPAFAQPDAAGNAVLALNAAPDSMQGMDIFLDAPSVGAGVRLRGGPFVPFDVNLASAINAVDTRVFIPDPNGGYPFANQAWSLLPSARITTVPELADFGDGPVQGRILEVRIGGFPTSFTAWQAASFTNPSDLANPLISGPGADPHGTGHPNLVRYALELGLHDDPAPRVPHFTGTADSPAIRLPFDPGRNDVACVIEAATDPSDWSSARVLFDSRIHFPPNNGSGWITIGDTAAPGAQCFYRVRFILLED